MVTSLKKKELSVGKKVVWEISMLPQCFAISPKGDVWWQRGRRDAWLSDGGYSYGGGGDWAGSLQQHGLKHLRTYESISICGEKCHVRSSLKSKRER